MPARNRSPFANQKPPAGCPIDWGHNLARGLSSAWHGNEGGGTLAFSPTGITNGIFGANAKLGADSKWPAWQFDGSSASNIDISPGIPFWSFGLNTFAIEAWVRTSAAARQEIISTQNFSTANGWAFEFSAAGKLVMNISTTGGAFTALASALAYNDGLWHQVVTVRDSSAGLLKLYVDGKLVGSGTDGARNVGINAASAYIGATIFGVSPSFNWTGAIGLVRIWSGRLITGPDVMALYQEPFAMLRAPGRSSGKVAA